MSSAAVPLVPYTTILEIEESSLNAWPAVSTVCRQGCLLRFADGYTKRSNSVNALYRFGDAAELIDYAEAAYAGRKLSTVFKILGSRAYEELDSMLDGRGYKVLDRTTVRTADLSRAGHGVSPEVRIEESFSAEWVDGFIGANHLEPRAPAVRSVLGLIQVETLVASVVENGRISAFGFAAVEDKRAGFFDIFVRQERRGSGLGRKIMESLMAAARNAGAEEGYLQVMDNNLPAQALYDKLGFRPLYPYWYRVRE